MAGLDSSPPGEETIDAPTASAEDQDLFEIGGDLLGEDSSEDVSDASPETSGTPEFDPDNVDWLRVDPTTLPDQYKPLSGMAKTMQATFTRNNQELKTRQDQLQRQEQQVRDYVSRTQQQQQNQPQNAQDEYADLKERLRASGDEDAAQGIDVVRDIIKREAGGRLEEMTTKYSQLENYVKVLAAHLVSQNTQSANSQWGKLAEQHGQDTVQNYRPAAEALMRTTNPATGKAYDADTAIRTVAGLLQQQADNLRETDTSIRTKARARVKPSPQVQTGSGRGDLSDTELRNELQALGFE